LLGLAAHNIKLDSYALIQKAMALGLDENQHDGESGRRLGGVPFAIVISWSWRIQET
jgi:hypothetical protein